MRKLTFVLLTLLTILAVLAGCAAPVAPTQPTAPAAEEPAAAESSAAAPFRVAVVLPSTINDLSWSQSIIDSLKACLLYTSKSAKPAQQQVGSDLNAGLAV